MTHNIKVSLKGFTSQMTRITLIEMAQIRNKQQRNREIHKCLELDDG